MTDQVTVVAHRKIRTFADQDSDIPEGFHGFRGNICIATWINVEQQQTRNKKDSKYCCIDSDIPGTINNPNTSMPLLYLFRTKGL